jgi:addiction module HigA family antidote
MDDQADEYAVATGPAWRPSHPGAVLREDILPAAGLTVTVAAERLGISRQMLHGILAERHALSTETALRIGKLCGNGPSIWLRMQQAYDLWQAERDMADELARIPTLTAA